MCTVYGVSHRVNKGRGGMFILGGLDADPGWNTGWIDLGQFVVLLVDLVAT